MQINSGSKGRDQFCCGPKRDERDLNRKIGLSGAVRPVIHAGPRLKEAGKLGFRYAVLPQMQQTNDEDDSAGVTPRPLSGVGALVAEIARSAARLRASG
ncbi:MAG: hypothetical protein WA733_08080 [Methylocystis sp.]